MRQVLTFILKLYSYLIIETPESRLLLVVCSFDDLFIKYCMDES